MLRLEYPNPGLPDQPLKIHLPGSKSISNRLLLLNAVSGSQSSISGLSDSRDTRLLKSALEDSTYEKWFEDGATPFRFYLMYAAVKGIACRLDGSPGLRKRSMVPLIDLLRKHGVEVHCTEKEGFAPLEISGQFQSGSELTMDVAMSSQFASAVLLVSPLIASEFLLHLMHPGTSHSYLDLSLGCMKLYGTEVLESRPDLIHLRNSGFGAIEVEMICEADWSAASYFYALCACLPGSRFVLKGLGPDIFQADSILREWGKQLGVLTEETEDGEVLIIHYGNISSQPDFDFANNIDLAPAIICCCAFLGIQAKFFNLENLKYKESDRLEVMAANLRKFGVGFMAGNRQYSLEFNGAPTGSGDIFIETHNDHRMAMAFSIFALRHPLVIDDAECVAKSFPGFWNELRTCNFVMNGQK